MKRLLYSCLALTVIVMMSGCGVKQEEHGQRGPAIHEVHKDHDKHESHDEQGGHVEQVDHDEHGHSEQSKSGNHDDHEGHDEDNIVSLSPSAMKTIGLTLQTAKYDYLYFGIQLNGEVGPNEDKLQHIAPRFPGLVKAVYKKQGDKVGKGEKLALIQNNETLANYYVQSFYAGTVIEKHITVGEVVDNSQTLFVVADLNTLWANFDVYAKDEAKIKKGQKVLIQMVGAPKTAEGTINYVSQVYDRSKRSLTARVALPNRELKWKPGTFVSGRIDMKSRDKKMLIDRQAVQTFEDQSILFIPEGKHRYTWITVKTGASNQRYIEILAGLAEGDSYVSQGAFELKSELVTRNLGSHAGHGH